MTFDEQIKIATTLGVAAVGGLAVGIEREWSGRASGEKARFAGVRTFVLIGLLGGLSVQLIQNGLLAIGTTVFIAAALVVVAAYAAAAYRGERESTTEFAGILVLATGALAGTGELALASAINAFLALILVEKSQIHSLVFRIQSDELIAGFRFAALALVVLPLLPAGPFGPDPGIRPRELWALVLLFSGLSFAGYIARRSLGAGRGYRLAGLIGGLISSTVVTLNFSRESRSHSTLQSALAFGVVAASTVLFLRVIVLMLVLNRNVAFATLPYLAIPFVIGAGLIAFSFRHKEEAGACPEPQNPLRLLSAIQLALGFQAALYLIKWVSAHFGNTGIFVTSLLVGMTDVDTLTFMIAKQTGLDPAFAARALTGGVLSNTILKLLIALILGKGVFRKTVAISLGALAICTMIVLLIH